jgi:CRISPR type III-B/RAMP module RAMP protein Cmr1
MIVSTPPRPLTYIIKPLTPLWTGGYELGKSSAYEPTGIWGGVRWWSTVILRGILGQMDYSIAQTERDLKSNERTRTDICQYKPDDRNPHLPCALCRAFGCTNWAPAVNVSLQENETGHRDTRELFLGYGATKPGWFLPDAFSQEFKMHLRREVCRSRDMRGGRTSEDAEVGMFLVQCALAFVSKHATLGAKTAPGGGVIDVSPAPELTVPGQNLVERMGTNQPCPGLLLYPSLLDVHTIECEVSLPEQHQIPPPSHTSCSGKLSWQPRDGARRDDSQRFHPLGVLIRRTLRASMADRTGRHFLMGAVDQNPNQASKIHISHFYPAGKDQGKWHLRIWAWLPQSLPGGREDTSEDRSAGRGRRTRSQTKPLSSDSYTQVRNAALGLFSEDRLKELLREAFQQDEPWPGDFSVVSTFSGCELMKHRTEEERVKWLVKTMGA